jgi:N-acetylglucosaminyldiphosphoundecaprenol N-acetyl-beta-D-mannosaminyltransferase
MATPTSPGGYIEAEETSAINKRYLTPDVAMMRRSPTSAEIAAALSVAPRAANPDSSARLDLGRHAGSANAPLKSPRTEAGNARPGAIRARRTPRPLGLVPRLTRSLPQPLRAPAKVWLTGVRIDCVTEKQVISRVISSIREGRGGWIVTPNVDHLRIISQRPDLIALVDQASLRVADGMPLIWASRIQGTPLPERVTGAGLTVSLATAAAKAGASIFLLGGNPGDGEAAADVLRRLNPGLKIAGMACPPHGFENDPIQMAQLGDALRSAKPDIVYTCFGFPKDPIVICELRQHLLSGWFLGLGGSLSIVSGRTRRAPRWMQRIGMEWLWRLGLEPGRLFERYIVNDLPFAIRLLVSSIAQR